MTPRRIRRRRADNMRRPRGGSGFAPSFPFTVASLSPNVANQGAAATPVNVNGEDFQSGATVYVDGVSQTTGFSGPTLLTFTMPTSILLVPGYKTVVVKRTTFTSNTRLFAVLFPVPTLLTATVSLPMLNVTGTGFFASGIHARIDGTIEAAFTYLTATTGTVAIPQAVLDTPGTHTVAIYSDAPGGGTSASKPFTMRWNASVITSLSTTQQYAGRASGTMVIAADPSALFYPESVVHVDGALASPSSLIDPGHIQVNIAGALLPAGTRNVTVFNPTAGGGGGESNALPFLSFSPSFSAISISVVPQYFDGFDVTGHVDMIDSNFEATFNNVAQPTTILDASNFIVSMTSAAIAVPGVTTVRLRDTISGATTNAQTITVQSWDPSRLGATLRLWLDGSSLVNDGAGKVAQWNDKSGGGRHCMPVTAGQLATIVAASPSLNNMPAARFAASPVANYVYTPWLVDHAVGLINKDKYTIWVAAVSTSTGTGQAILGDYFGLIYVAKSAYDLAPANLAGIDTSAPSSTSKLIWKWNPPPAAPFALRQRKNSALAQFATRVNRNAEDVQVPGTDHTAFVPTNCYVGAASSTAGAWVGDIAEIVICDTDVNSTHKAIMDNRLSYLYGFPFGTGPKAQITSITPPTCTQFDRPFYLYVNDTGGGYTVSSVVNAYDTPLVTEYLSSTQIRARLTNDALAQMGGLPISVADGRGISAPVGLTIFPFVDVPGVPNLHTTIPNAAIQHGDPLALRVLGAGFTAASVIKWNGNAIATSLVSGELRGTLPATAFDVLPGPVITVSDPSGDSPNSCEVTLTPWSPLNILGLTGWWAADDVIVAGGKVTQFNDKSGKGRHWTQSDPLKQAIYAASDAAFNGKPSAQFDGVISQYAGQTGVALLGQKDSVSAFVYRHLVVDGAGNPTTQPFANDVMFAVPGFGLAAHLSPLTLIAYGNDGSYRSVSHTGLVVGQTQRCQMRITANVMTLEIGDVATAPFTLATFSMGGAGLVGYINFSTNNAMNGKLTTWFTTNAAWPAQDSICWRNFCRYNYGTTA